ncbi:MAG: acetyl-CoA carboxylase biotin carboxyl carrier protein [Opitutales bacterium]|nr:acetyl-CoA carboxylase biotin carboxyl carrier protein [Opitutales bacterium]NRA27039.1 acetyl-CoA carboxylase biotin carboxyl carrier protein [Opitutales bacterium]
MDLKNIKQLVDLMKRGDLTDFEIEEEGLKLRISREGSKTEVTAPQVAYMPAPAAYPPAMPAQVPIPQADAATTPAENPADDAGAKLIKSPMVGTFYRSPSPEAKAFVEKGATVSVDSTVCIIEAMKVMNEIQAEESGTIVEILVENGAPVEYGQPLFKLK